MQSRCTRTMNIKVNYKRMTMSKRPGVVGMVLSVMIVCMVVNVNAQKIDRYASGAGVAAGGIWVTAYMPEFGDLSPAPAQIDWTAFTQIVIFTTEPTKNPPYYFRELPGAPDSANFDGGYNKRIAW